MSGLGRTFARLGTIKFWRDLLLTVGAVVGTLCIVATLAMVAFDMKPLVFRSGSMSPAIDTGALAYAKGTPVGDLKNGDIVSVENSSGTRITHRITAIEPNGSRAALTLKGDANEDADAVPYVVSSADRVVFSIPRAGYVVAWLSGPIGIFAGGLLVGLLSIIAFTPGRGRKHGGNKRGGMKRDGALVAVLAIGLAGMGTAGSIRPVLTEAYFTNLPTATSGALTAHTVAAPVLSCNQGVVRSVTFTWTAVSPVTNYTFTYNKGSGVTPRTLTGTSITITSTANQTAGTATVRANRDFTNDWSSVASNSKTYVLTNAGTTESTCLPQP